MKFRAVFPAAVLFAAGLLFSPGGARAQEAVPLFNGRDLSGWTTADGKAVTGKGWAVEEGGILHRAAKGGDIFTASEYGNYELAWEWKIAAGGNSGVKYRMMKYPDKGWLGFEYQLLDDAGHPDGKIGPHRQTASLYDILPPATDKPVRPPGEWNTSKVVVRDQTIEHWLNGVKVLSVDLRGEPFKAARAKSKFKGVSRFGENLKGRIMIQDHNDEAWFRNITLKPL